MTQIIETDEAGRLILQPEMLGNAKPHTRYALQEQGPDITLRLASAGEADNTSFQEKLTPEEWLKQWRELAEEVGKVWPADKTAADIISEMRR